MKNEGREDKYVRPALDKTIKRHLLLVVLQVTRIGTSTIT